MQEKILKIIRESGYLKEAYDDNKLKKHQYMYDILYTYAYANQLFNTAIALEILPRFFFPVNPEDIEYNVDNYSQDIYMDHALSIARMLMDLHPDISKEEEDITLATALCHVLVEKIHFKNSDEELYQIFKLDKRIYDYIIINIMNKRGNKEQKERYYETIQANKIALLVKLADRCKIVEQLYMSSLTDALMYVKETKNNFYSMCLYGKEHYPDLYLTITLLMDKIKNLVDVSDILASRYTQRKNILLDEILTLKEENIRLKAIIAQLENN